MIKEVLKKSPYFIKKPLKAIYNDIPDRIKYGKSFVELYNFLQQSQYCSKEKLEEYQLKELKRLLNHAYNNVPYYTKVFNERGLKPKDIKDFNDLKKLPYLTKDIIRENFNDLIAKNFNKKNMTYCTTGGSTGIPLGFYIDKNARSREWAFMTSQWARVGYDINKKNKIVVLRGDIPHGDYYEYVGNKLILSSFKIGEQNFLEYVKRIKEFNPDFIHVYPSSISILANYMIDKNICIDNKNLKAILCGSENIYENQRESIKKAFNCDIYSWYGHSEKCCLAGECEKSSYYHIFSEYGYAELINEQNEECTKESELGEIVVTGFNNYAMPFIRYKTCDIAVNTNKQCDCNRNYRLIKKIDGRFQEYVIDKNGGYIPLTTLIYGQHFDIMGKFSVWQITQNEKGKILIKVENNNSFKKCDLEEIKIKLQKVLKNNLKIEMIVVNKIERIKSGKFKFLIQNTKL